MGFTVVMPETIDLDVNVEVPGVSNKQIFSITTKYLTRKERREFLDEINDNRMGDLDVLKKLVVGWSNVREENGEDMPFNASNLERLLDIPYCHRALMNTIVTEYLSLMPDALALYARKN